MRGRRIASYIWRKIKLIARYILYFIVIILSVILSLFMLGGIIAFLAQFVGVPMAIALLLLVYGIAWFCMCWEKIADFVDVAQELFRFLRAAKVAIRHEWQRCEERLERLDSQTPAIAAAPAVCSGCDLSVVPADTSSNGLRHRPKP